MTLEQAVERLRDMFKVNQNADFDTSDPSACVARLNEAAQHVAEDCLHLWTPQATVTLTQGVTDYNIADATICPQRVFTAYSLVVDGQLLEEFMPDLFAEMHPDLAGEAQGTPSHYMTYAPSYIRLSCPPSAGAVAATPTYVSGFRYPSTMVWGRDNDTQLEGLQTTHLLVIYKAYLDGAVAYGRSGSAANEYATIFNMYNERAKEIMSAMLARHRPLKRTGRKMGLPNRVIHAESF